MKTKFFALVMLIFASLGLLAQSGGGGYFLTGYTYFPKIPQMNTSIQGVNNSLPQGIGVMGGGGYAIFNGFVIGGRGMGSSFMNNVDIPEVTAEHTFGGGEFNLGHVLFYNKSLLSFVYLGIGGYSYGVEINNSGTQTIDLNSVVVSPGATVNYEYQSFTLTGGVSLKLVKFTGFDLGLDISYIYPVSDAYQAVMFGLTLGGLGVGK